MEGPTPPLPGARQPAPAGPVTGYFYLLSLTVQAQGATNCGSRLRKLAHESPSDCSGLVAAASWLRVRAGRPGPAGKGSVAPLLGCVGVRMGTPKLREARGPQKGGWGRRCRLEHGAQGVAISHPTQRPPGWALSDGSRGLFVSTAQQGPVPQLPTPPLPPPLVYLPLQGKAVPNTDSPKL